MLYTARLTGQTRYFTGLPCKRGHVCERFTKDSTCLQCRRLQTESYRERNPANVSNWITANRERWQEVKKEWKAKNKDKVHASAAKYRVKNGDAISAYQRIWHERNAKAVAEKSAKWAANNKDRRCVTAAKRRAAAARATVSFADETEIASFYLMAVSLSTRTGVRHEVDHIVPLVSRLVCGLHCQANLQVIPASKNRRKSNRVWPDMPEREVNAG